VSPAKKRKPPPPPPPAPTRDVTIAEDMIRLGQLLKLSGLAESGAEARSLVQEGLVLVNGEVETRRGRQLHRGDLVTVDGERVRVA
jgi:ribosome-associated protein